MTTDGLGATLLHMPKWSPFWTIAPGQLSTATRRTHYLQECQSIQTIAKRRHDACFSGRPSSLNRMV